MSAITPSMAIDRMRKFCSYQERAHSEVRTKLLKLQIYGDDLEDIINELIGDDYLNEERYARSYVRGKFRINKWGRFKIRMNLQQKRVSDYCINKGMEEIDEQEYIDTIDNLLLRKLAGNTDFKSKQKARDSVMRKGFEPEIVSSRLRELSD